MPAVSILKQVELRGLSLVTVGDRVEVRRGKTVVSFGANPEKACAKALVRLEEERLRDLDKTPEAITKVEVKTERLLIARAAAEAMNQPVPTKGAYELDPARDDSSGVSKSVVKSKYRDKYKANGFNCGDLIAGEMQAYVCVMKGTRLTIDQARLNEVAKTNGVWHDRYLELNVGMARMNIGNRLRNKYNNGEKIDIGGCIFEKQFD